MWDEPVDYDGIGDEVVMDWVTNTREVEYALPIPPAPYKGLDYCGSASALVNGAEPDIDPLFVTNAIGQAPCCASKYLRVWTGGDREGGPWPFGQLVRQWQGGDREGGPWPLATPGSGPTIITVSEPAKSSGG
jgi:hypothetical protein